VAAVAGLKAALSQKMESKPLPQLKLGGMWQFQTIDMLIGSV
jgi:hypothetical protein